MSGFPGKESYAVEQPGRFRERLSPERLIMAQLTSGIRVLTLAVILVGLVFVGQSINSAQGDAGRAVPEGGTIELADEAQEGGGQPGIGGGGFGGAGGGAFFGGGFGGGGGVADAKGLIVSESLMVVVAPDRSCVSAFSVDGGSWQHQTVTGHEGKDIPVVVGSDLACFQAGDRLYAFSGPRGTWHSVEIPADPHAANFIAVGRQLAWYRGKDRLYTFSAVAGGWDSIEVSPAKDVAEGHSPSDDVK
jgi:hypothetical protein